MHELAIFNNGAIAMGAAVAALFFYRFWRDTRDRFFVLFTAAFAIMAANWTALATITPAAETRHYFYLFRLLAFSLILIAIIDKNRKPR
jgi:hypothetical protein